MKLGGPAIHPGEILSDELAEIGVTASDLARAIGVPINRVTHNTEGPAGHHGGHGAQARSVVRLRPGDLDGPAEGLRVADGGSGTRRRPQDHSSPAGTARRSATGLLLMVCWIVSPQEQSDGA